MVVANDTLLLLLMVVADNVSSLTLDGCNLLCIIPAMMVESNIQIVNLRNPSSFMSLNLCNLCNLCDVSFILSLVRKNEARTFAFIRKVGDFSGLGSQVHRTCSQAEAKMAKISVLGAKTPKLPVALSFGLGIRTWLLPYFELSKKDTTGVS